MKRLFKKLAGLMMGLLAVAGLAGLGAADVTKADATKGAGDEIWSMTGTMTGWSVSAKTYTFTYNNSRYELKVNLAANDEFKIIYNYSSWDIGYGQNTGGGISTYLSNSGGNFKVKTAGYYLLIVKDDNVHNYGDKSYGFSIEVCEEELASYSVTYYDGATVKKSETLEEGTAIQCPLYEKEGYMLEGWYTDANLTNKFEKGSQIKSDLNLYANYVKTDSYVVYFDAGTWTTVNAHIWSDDVVSGTEWPGVAMTNVAGTSFYYYEMPVEKSYDRIIFNTSSGSTQTVNIDLVHSSKIYSLGAKDTTETAKYTVNSVDSSKVVAHINGEVVNVADHFAGFTGNVTATTTGFSSLALTKNGWALTNLPENADLQAAFEAYMSSVDTCDDFVNVDAYIELAAGLDTSVTISDNGGEVTIANKLEYMKTYKAWKAAHPNENNLGSNLLTNLTSSNNTLIVLIVGLLGLTAVGVYYFLNKKKFAK